MKDLWPANQEDVERLPVHGVHQFDHSGAEIIAKEAIRTQMGLTGAQTDNMREGDHDERGSNSSGTSSTPTNKSTGSRRSRPGSIPGFPSANAPREPGPQIAFSPSPSHSPSKHSTTTAAGPSKSLPPMRLPSQPFTKGSMAGSPSPWHALAASSGAPTPSLDGRPGKGSPQLGFPFEKLDIGASWSGSNLVPQERSGSPLTLNPSDGRHGLPKGNTGLGVKGLSPDGPTPEMMAAFRAMTGKASARGHRSKKEDSSSGEGESASGSSGSSNGSGGRLSLPATLAKRRASATKNGLDPLNPHHWGPKGSSPLSISSSSPTPKLQPLTSVDLDPLLRLSSTLILDLRPPSSFNSSHLPTSHSIPIPSTLLKRPAFDLGKLTSMLKPTSQEAVSQWRKKVDIVLVDNDSSIAPETSVLGGLAGKFEREGYEGNLWFVKGGHCAVAAKGYATVSGDGDDDMSDPSNLKVGNLGSLAFQSGSTGSLLQGKSEASSNFSNFGGSIPTTSMTERPSRGPPSMIGLSLGNASSSSLALSSDSGGSQPAKLQPANPFFDNIRQNLELSRGNVDRIPLILPEGIEERLDDLPPWLALLVELPEDEAAKRLAEEFYDVELGEQKRLQSVMDWHSKGSGRVWDDRGRVVQMQKDRDTKEVERLNDDRDDCGGVAEPGYFPFSITAGVEMGSKNRYKNIWPYEFSRVKLDSMPGEGDYINASYVQPKATARRYIATQGPLDATYCDFWTLVWEQDVKVIVMLTKQFEGGSLKCGNYWQDQQYGPTRLHLVSHQGGEDIRPSSETSGFNFGSSASLPRSATDDAAHKSDYENIRRVFLLSRTDKPEVPPRKVVQIQCTAWPDFDVPDSPSVLLNLLSDVDGASRELCVEEGDDRADHPPVIVHCSAGVGRTGSFIIVDAILDALRTERTVQRSAEDSSRFSSPRSQPSGTPLSLPPTSPFPFVLMSREASAGLAEVGAGSVRNGPEGSGDSGKSVSFAPLFGSENPASNGGLPGVFSTSPDAGAPMPGPPSLSPRKRRHDEVAVDAHPTVEQVTEKTSERMDIDVPEDDRRRSDDNVSSTPEPGSPPLEARFRHRGSVEESVFSERSEPVRRPSLGSARGSSDQIGGSAPHEGLDVPSALTESGKRHRSPSPLDVPEGVSPVQTVLEGMRVQRMSLVQSLRQYLFVHRAILQGYLDLTEEIPLRHPIRRSNTAQTSASTEDETCPKRRASPTELVPEKQIGESTSNLTKRPSFKKMRATGGPESITSIKEEEVGGRREVRRKALTR